MIIPKIVRLHKFIQWVNSNTHYSKFANKQIKIDLYIIAPYITRAG